MTKEELEKEARKDVDSLNGVDLVSSTMVAIDRYGAYKIGRYDGYLAGAEPREKRIAELEAQIEKMKWHYLVENPKDLPKKEGTYWVCVRDGRYKEDGSWEWTSKPLCKTAVWLDGVFGYAGGSPVIGWCELPKWEIKEK